MQRNKQKFNGSEVDGCTKLCPRNCAWGSLCSIASPTLLFFFCLFFSSHCNRWEVIPLHGFDLLLPDDEWCWASFMYLLTICMSFLKEMSIRVLCPFLNWVTWFFTIELWVPYIYWVLSPYQMCGLQMFSPTFWCYKNLVPHNYPLSQLNFWSSANYCLTVIYFMYF